MQNPVHPDLLAAKKLAYEPSSLTCTMLQQEPESADYGAYTFQLNDRKIKFRVAKTTPTKVGQFVTLWKRIGTGPILPHDMADPVDLFIVSVRTPEHFGQFVFPKSVLCKKDVISKDGKGGKRAMRVYPPWGLTDSRQAKTTQAWQANYFITIPSDGLIDKFYIRQLCLTDN